MRNHQEFMNEAIKEAYKGITAKDGGPFGAIIVKDGKIIARGHNQVLKTNDPTMHGEIDVIRKACKKLNTYDLTGCYLYTTGEPCTMCLCAAMWANIKHIYFGATLKDNEDIGFRDNQFNNLLGSRKKVYDTRYCTRIGRDSVLELYKAYSESEHENY